MKIKDKIKIVITVETIRKMEKTAHRVALVEAGIYSRPTHKVHKSIKDYNRKPKYKKDYFIE
jgi:hypothetical protein